MEIEEFRPWEDIPYKLDSLRNLRNIEFRLGTVPTKYLPDFEKDIEICPFTINSDSRCHYTLTLKKASVF